MSSLREFLEANMFDGDDGGNITMNVGPLLDEVCELVEDWGHELREAYEELYEAAGALSLTYPTHPHLAVLGGEELEKAYKRVRAAKEAQQ